MEGVDENSWGGKRNVAYHENQDAAQKAKNHDQNATTEHHGENPFLTGHETGFPNHLGERLACCWEQ